MNDLLILAMLLRGPTHGYQLKREIGTLVGGTKLHNNQLYPALRRFVKNRWVTRRAAAGERGQTRHLYSLTAPGRQELLARASAFTEDDAVSAGSFWIRVGLFSLLSADDRTRILEARERHLRQRVAALSDVEARHRLDRYAAAITAHAKATLQAELDWIGQLRRVSDH